MNQLKKCTKCNITKKLSIFSKDSSKKDGYHSRCKECTKESRKKYTEQIIETAKPIVEEKHCPQCNTTKDRNEFSKDSRKKDGLQSYCKECKKQQLSKKNKNITIPKEKKCKHCKKTKILINFNKTEAGKYGVSNNCKDCISHKNKEKNFSNVNILTIKVCSGCNNTKNVSMFSKDKYNSTGLQSKCKECQNQNHKERHDKLKNIKKEIPLEKHCPKCDETKNSSMFSKDSRKNDGLQGYCKQCKKTQATKNSKEKVPLKKTCRICEESKLISGYNKSLSGKYGLSNECKECRSINRRKLDISAKTTGTKVCPSCDKELHVNKYNKDKSIIRDGLQSCCKECQKIRGVKWASTFDGFIKKLFGDIKSNARRRTKTLKVEITTQDIIDMYKKQNGKCALTQKEMTYKAYVRTKEEQHIMNKKNISVDRIDSSKGYTKDNIQLVCAIINRMKTDMTNDEFEEWCNIVKV